MIHEMLKCAAVLDLNATYFDEKLGLLEKDTG